MESSPKGINYKIFKEDLKLENYLLKLPSKKYKLLCRFRCCNFEFYPLKPQALISLGGLILYHISACD
jgi:hypothetical protein